jgi:hypothetical protein
MEKYRSLVYGNIDQSQTDVDGNRLPKLVRLSLQCPTGEYITRIQGVQTLVSNEGKEPCLNSITVTSSGGGILGRDGQQHTHNNKKHPTNPDDMSTFVFKGDNGFSGASIITTTSIGKQKWIPISPATPVIRLTGISVTSCATFSTTEPPQPLGNDRENGTLNENKEGDKVIDDNNTDNEGANADQTTKVTTEVVEQRVWATSAFGLAYSEKSAGETYGAFKTKIPWTKSSKLTGVTIWTTGSMVVAIQTTSGSTSSHPLQRDMYPTDIAQQDSVPHTEQKDSTIEEMPEQKEKEETEEKREESIDGTLPRQHTVWNIGSNINIPERISRLMDFEYEDWTENASIVLVALVALFFVMRSLFRMR